MFKNPLVVGYKGEIGSFILQGLLKEMPKANNIWATDINNTRKETIDRIKKSDAIFLCVPIECTPCWLDEYRQFLKGKLIIEQTSLKSYIHDCKCKCLKGLKVLSMHLLFKPSATPNPADRNIGFLDKSLFDYSNICNFIATMCQSKIIKFQDFEHHDYRMSREQALLHRVILALDKSLGNIEGKTFLGLKIQELANRIKKMNPVLFETIQSNKHLPTAIKEFEDILNSLDKLKIS